MGWTELPPDFIRLRLADAIGNLPVADAVALARVAAKRQRSFLIDYTASQLARHHVERYRHETGGLLVGKVLASDSLAGPRGSELVVVCDAIPAERYSGTSTSLRMESELWRKANSARGEGEFVVGWFHSHPNLGAFFSGTDRRTQAAFFAMEHTIAWVIDPVRQEEAWFRGPNSEPVTRDELYVGPFRGL
jgi:proteasome lid subunit RPN8/RPN11